jgi:phosphatidylglycerophosphate synthase
MRMIGSYLRRRVRRVLEGISLRWNISPNLVSISTVFPAAAAVYFLMNKMYPAAVLLILASIALDMLDGKIARTQKKASKFGAYLDPMMDKVVELLIYMGLFLGGFKIEAFVALAGIFLIGAAKSWAFMVIPLKNFDWPAIGERAERYMILFPTLIVASFRESVLGISVVSAGLWLIAALVYAGTVQRMVFAKKIIEETKTMIK